MVFPTHLTFGIRGRREIMADAGGGRELLEPRHDAEASREKLVCIKQICVDTNVAFR